MTSAPTLPWRIPASLLLAASLTGCGVMFGGTTETIRVTSTPAGARLSSQPPVVSVTTPASLSLQRKNAYVLIAQLDGYRLAELEIRQEMRMGALIMDILFTGLVGVVVDAVTGGWWNLEPDDATMVLERVTGDSGTGPDRIEIHVSVDREKSSISVHSDVPGVRLMLRQAP